MIGNSPKSVAASSLAAMVCALPPHVQPWSATSSCAYGTLRLPPNLSSAKASPSLPSEVSVALYFSHTPMSTFSSASRSRSPLSPSSPSDASRSSSGIAVYRFPSAPAPHPSANASKKPTPSSQSLYSTSATSVAMKLSTRNSPTNRSPSSAIVMAKP
jgi:hypothetical protein